MNQVSTRLDQIAESIDSIALPMGAEPAAIRAIEERIGIPVPTAVATFLGRYSELGTRLFDPEGHAGKSPALAQLLSTVEESYVPLGVIGPGREDVLAGRTWWYPMFRLAQEEERIDDWGDEFVLRLAEGEEAIAEAEATYDMSFPTSYRHLLCVFSQVLFNWLYLHEGLVGPETGACTKGFDGEIAYIRMWLESGSDLGGMRVEDLENYLPFYADQYGNEYVFSRQEPGAVLKFDHESCEVCGTDYPDFDAFFSALLARRLG